MGHLPRLARFSSKLVLQILPSVSATVIGGYLLAQIHIGRPADPPPPQIVIAPTAAPPASEAPTAREERAAMRQVLKQRRENPEAPEVVRPVATAQPAAPATTASVPPASMDSIAPNEPVERAAGSNRPKAGAPARRDVERTDAADYVPPPPPGLPAASATAINAPTPVAPPPVAPPAVASTQPIAPAPAAQPIVPAPVAPAPQMIPAAPAPQMTPAAPPQVATAPTEPPARPPSRGPVDAVFSTLSNVIGHAANATGNTVNWVIDLPGKAISAGGRVINGPSTPPPPPARLGDEG